MITKPLLASAVEDITTLKYPIGATTKLDGVRCLKIGDKVVTRNFKPFPNHYIRTTLEKILPDQIDGEVLYPGKTFNEVQSMCMTEAGEPDFIFYAFDYVKDDLAKPYCKRMEDLLDWYHWNTGETKNLINKHVICLFPEIINNVKELEKYESLCLSKGYEGVMIRDLQGKYKTGRSTIREGILLKMKRFTDAEAIVLNMEEKMHNENAAEKDAFGRTKRSSHKANLTGADTLGALVVKDCKSGLEFRIGSGFDDAMRAEIWNHQKKYLNKILTYKFQSSGAKTLPRFPIFKGWRDPRDI